MQVILGAKFKEMMQVKTADYIERAHGDKLLHRYNDMRYFVGGIEWVLMDDETVIFECVVGLLNGRENRN